MSNINLNQKAQKDFLVYANAVIKSRAIPKVEDNLKPVHRRILYTMAENKLWSNKNTVKSAKVVGLIMAYHPHGDAAIYDTLVRLGQPWKMRYPFIEIQGNAGSILGDKAAAMRYTECRLSKIGEMMLDGIDKGAVGFKPNYDETSNEPLVLPSRFPNILANGNAGIAVGMSSSLVPHNLNEVVDGIVGYLDNKNITNEQLMKYIPGPDFPTGGSITDAERLKEIYETGSGAVTLRGKYTIEPYGKNQQQIVFTEVPYLVNIREGIVEPLKKLVLEEDFDLIDDFQNDTNKDGISLKVILKKGANVYKVLEALWSKTRLQISQRISNTIIIDGNPKVLSLKDLIKHYVVHRHDCIINVAKHDLEKTNNRIMIVNALLMALAKIDEVIALIKSANDKGDARTKLMNFLNINNFQADAILDMRLSKLSKLDGVELKTELSDLQKKKEELEDIINNVITRENIIKKDLYSMKNMYGDKRRTQINYCVTSDAAPESAIENVNIMFFENGSTFATQKQIKDLGIGKRGNALNGTPITAIIETTNNKKISIFTREGSVYHQDVLTMGLETTEVSNIVGAPIAAIDFSSHSDKHYLLFVSSDGLVKKSKISNYTNSRNGTKSTKLKDGQHLVYVGVVTDYDYIFLLGESGKLVKFKSTDLNDTGRMTLGVKGMSDRIIAAAVGSDGDEYFTINKKGQGKITIGSDFNETARASNGQVIADGTVGICNTKKGYVIVFGDKKNNFVETKTFILKSKTAAGAKIVSTVTTQVVGS